MGPPRAVPGGGGRKISLVTGPPVLFEIAWTLRSAYDLPREKGP